MDTLPPMKKDQVLTQEAFDKLLAYLSNDREIAANQYETIRRKLITFFECRGCSNPEDYTDLTINRVARRINEGIDIRTSNYVSFFLGVARNILQESWGNMAQRSIRLDDPSILSQILEDPDEVRWREEQQVEFEQEMGCLEQCLNNILPKNRELILQYYQGETGVKINDRKALAERLGIPINALRIRALRIREKLEDCMTNCLKQLSGI